MLSRGPLYQSIQSLKSRFMQAARDMEQSYLSTPFSYIKAEEASNVFRQGAAANPPEPMLEIAENHTTQHHTKRIKTGDGTSRERSAPRTSKRHDAVICRRKHIRGGKFKHAYAEIYSRQSAYHHSSASMRLSSAACRERDPVVEHNRFAGHASVSKQTSHAPNCFS